MSGARLFFYEHLSLGKWWPRTEPDQPVVVNSEGSRAKIRGVVEVAEDHRHLDLNQLRELYSRDGSLVHTLGPDHVAKVMGQS